MTILAVWILCPLTVVFSLRPGYWRLRGPTVVSEDKDVVFYFSKLLGKDVRRDVLVVSCSLLPHQGPFSTSLAHLCASFHPDSILVSLEPEKLPPSSIATVPLPPPTPLWRLPFDVILAVARGLLRLLSSCRLLLSRPPAQLGRTVGSSSLLEAARTLQHLGQEVIPVDLPHSMKVNLVANSLSGVSLPLLEEEFSTFFGDKSPLGGTILEVSEDEVAETIVEGLSSDHLAEGTLSCLEHVCPDVLKAFQQTKAQNIIDFIVINVSRRKVIILLEDSLSTHVTAGLLNTGFTSLDGIDCDCVRTLCQGDVLHSAADPASKMLNSFANSFRYSLDMVRYFLVSYNELSCSDHLGDISKPAL